MGNTQQNLRRNKERPQVETAVQPPKSDEEASTTFTCQICFEPAIASTKMFKNKKKCAHNFCTDCMIRYIRVMVDERMTPILCPALNCRRILDPLFCRPFLAPNVFDKWCDVLCESAILGWEVCYCPNVECSAMVVNECGKKANKCKCPNCKRLFCFRCKTECHSGYGCKKSAKMRDSNDVEFGVLVKSKDWKRCPRCGHCIQRVSGCKSMECRCGAIFCYKCGSKRDNCKCIALNMRRCFEA